MIKCIRRDSINLNDNCRTLEVLDELYINARDAKAYLDGISSVELPEIVRCKHCAHSKWVEKEKSYYCQRKWSMYRVRERDFCSYGVRRKNVQIEYI